MTFGTWLFTKMRGDFVGTDSDGNRYYQDKRMIPGMRRRKRWVIYVKYPELGEKRRSWWLIVAPRQPVELCSVDPGFDVDLYISTDLRTMTAIWMGLDTVRKAAADKRMLLTGERELAANMQQWLGLSPFAKERKIELP